MSPSDQPKLAQTLAAQLSNGPSVNWWTPERVRNQAQCSFIKLQAEHFGDMSPAHRFFELCIDRGVMDRKGLYLGPAQPARQPGEDIEEKAA